MDFRANKQFFKFKVAFDNDDNLVIAQKAYKGQAITKEFIEIIGYHIEMEMFGYTNNR